MAAHTPTGPGQSTRLLLEVAQHLEHNQVDYAVVGAVAAAAYGVVRASLDADALLSLTIPDARQLEQTLSAAGYRTQLRVGDAEDPIPALVVVEDGFGNRVDLLVGLRGLEPAAMTRTVSISLQGRSLRFIGREDFVAMKLFAGGPQTQADACEVMKIAGGALDLDLTRRVAARYGRAALESFDRLLASGAPPRG